MIFIALIGLVMFLLAISYDLVHAYVATMYTTQWNLYKKDTLKQSN